MDKCDPNIESRVSGARNPPNLRTTLLMGENHAMPISSYSVRTINRQTGASEWVRVQAGTFEDAREQVERMGLVPHEVRIDEPGHASENAPVPRSGPPPLPGRGAFEAGGGDGGGHGQTPPVARGSYAAASERSRLAPTARTALLVSAIFNLLFAAGLIIAGMFVCFPLAMGIPLLVLGIYELRYRAMLDDPPGTRPPGSLLAPIRTLAVLEVVSIALGNMPSMVCGLLILVNQRELEEV